MTAHDVLYVIFAAKLVHSMVAFQGTQPHALMSSLCVSVQIKGLLTDGP